MTDGIGWELTSLPCGPGEPVLPCKPLEPCVGQKKGYTHHKYRDRQVDADMQTDGQMDRQTDRKGGATLEEG